MILDTLENAGLYVTFHPRFKQAFDFLNSTDLNALPLGKMELDGSDLFINVVELTAMTAQEAKMETHNRYIDIQIPITGYETMGWIAKNQLMTESETYNADKDVAFFADKASNFIHVQPLEFVIFFPTDGHQPGIADVKHKKIIVKVLL